MITGSIAYNSSNFGKIRLDYKFDGARNFSPDIDKGKFSVWTVKEVEGMEVRQDCVSIEKLQEIREKLVPELKHSFESLNICLKQATVDHMKAVEEKSPSAKTLLKLIFFQKARDDVFFMKCMAENWDYDTDL